MSRNMQMVVTRFERLSRRISLAGLMSGHKASQAIKQGRVLVDGRPAAANFKIFNEASVFVDGLEAKPPRPNPRLWAMYKPRKVLCQEGDKKDDAETIRSLLKERYEREVQLNGHAQSTGLSAESLADKHFVIVGGLSFAADGLVLLTNDGLFAETLQDVRSKILTAYDVKISGDPPVDLLHSWRRNARVGGIDYGQVFVSITKRTGATTKLRVRLVESVHRPLDLLMERAKMKVMAVHRYSFGPYLASAYPKDRCVEIPIHKSLSRLVPEADMRQVLVPTQGAILDDNGLLRTIGLGNSSVVGSDEADDFVDMEGAPRDAAPGPQ